MLIKGKIFKKIVGKNSKTEYEGLWIKHKNNTWIVRRRGQNPFRDPVLEKLVGQTISAEGELVKNIFFINNWKEILE